MYTIQAQREQELQQLTEVLQSRELQLAATPKDNILIGTLLNLIMFISGLYQ